MTKHLGENQSDSNPGDENKQAKPAARESGGYFEICIQGQLSKDWSDWLEGLDLNCLENGEMCLCGYIIDQAALMGVLNKLYRLNLALLSIKRVEPEK